MKKTLFLLLILSYFWSNAQEYKRMIETGNYSLHDIQSEANHYFKKVGTGKGTGYKQFKRWEYNAVREADANGIIPNPQDQIKAYKKFQSKQASQRTNQEQADWKEIGPTYWNRTSGWNPGVGRVTSIAVDPNNYNHIIVGGNTGGVWRTTDKGQNWSPLSDDLTTLDVYSVAIDPQDSKIYYWGSKWGIIYKSINSGQSWSKIGSAGSSNINKIIIHPTNPKILYASGSYSGFYKSTNGGTSWNKISNSTRGYDIEFKPGDPNTIYASGTSFYKSTNGGGTFTSTNGVGSGIKLIGISDADPSRVYLLEASGGKFGGFYKSTNSGTSFTKLNHGTKNYFGYSATASDDSGQAPRDMAIAVNPSDADEVHIAGILTWRSKDAGTSFDLSSHWTHSNANRNNVGYCHADVDIMQYHGNTLYVGTDGGIYISENASKTISTNYYTDLSTGLGIRQFYKIGVSQSDPVVISGGAQDNGTSVWKGGTDSWTDWLGADGMESFVDWSNPNTLYGTSQNGSMYKSTNGGNTYSGISKPDDKKGNWVTPFEQDPTNANTIYVGVNQVYKKVGSGNWSAISQEFSGNLNHLKIAPSNNKVMYAAKGSSLYRTSTASGTWATLSGTSGTINSIAIHPTNPNKIAVATTSTSTKVYVSNNGGTTWTSYKKNLPSLTALALVWDKENNNGLYLGMSYGIYYINDNLTDWILYVDNLPNSKVNELEINFPTNKLYAATYGRGMWEASLYGQAQAVATDIKINTIQGTSVSGCGLSMSPSVTIKNNGTDMVTSFTAKLFINNVLKKTINKTSLSLASKATTTVQFGNITGDIGSNNIKVVISKPNGITDEKPDNNELSQTTTLEEGNLHTFYIDETSKSNQLNWIITDAAGSTIKQLSDATETSNNNQTEFAFCLVDGCFDIEITDAFNSGSCNVPDWDPSISYPTQGTIVAYNNKKYRSKWWANPGDEPGVNSVWELIGDCVSSNPTDKLELKNSSGTTYFESTVATYTSPLTENFCNGNSLSVDFSSNKTSTVNCKDITFTANVTGNATSYTWDFGAGATPATATGIGPHQVSYTTTGNKTISLDADGTEETKTDYITVTQDQSKVATVSIAITMGKNPSCGGEDIEFTASSTNEGNNPSYSWNVNNTSVGTGNTFTMTSFNNNDEITCDLVSNEACVVNTKAYSNNITLIKEVCTGSQEWLESVAAIYPNPATDQLTIRSQNNASFSWIIYDNHGRTLNIGNINDDSKTLDLSTYNSGIYYVKIITNDKSSIVEIIKN